MAWCGRGPSNVAIASFKHKGLEELLVAGKTKKVRADLQRNALRILDHLNAITDLKDCIGVKDFHQLKGARKGTYSMHVNGNYCITFRWLNGEARDIDLEDYH
jgi:proteic killer suppression protein